MKKATDEGSFATSSYHPTSCPLTLQQQSVPMPHQDIAPSAASLTGRLHGVGLVRGLDSSVQLTGGSVLAEATKCGNFPSASFFFGNPEKGVPLLSGSKTLNPKP